MTFKRPYSAGLAAFAVGLFATTAAYAEPTVNKGDNAWMLTSTVLVLLMTIPGLALFYGGLVRSKNMLSVLMQVFYTVCIVTILWTLYGYSLAFTGGSDCSACSLAADKISCGMPAAYPIPQKIGHVVADSEGLPSQRPLRGSPNTPAFRGV